MKEQSAKIMKLGAFVLVAIICLILGLYYIGSKRNIFRTTIHVSAIFNNVSGLMPGNNVQFNGINVGTVSKVYAISDTTIKVEFTIDKNSTEFITQNAITSISTDGLLGNKLVTISPTKKGGLPLHEGTIMNALNAINTDNAMRTLLVTNDNLKVISENLKVFTNNFNSSNSLFNVLTDTTVSENVRMSLDNIKMATNHASIITRDLSKIVQDVKSGKGTIGALLTDTLFSRKLHQTIVNMNAASDSILIVAGNLKNVTEKIKNGKGAIATLLSDTTFSHNLNSSMYNIKMGSKSFSEDMEALKHSWPFKKYFKTVKKTE